MALSGTAKGHRKHHREYLQEAIRDVKQARALMRNGNCLEAFESLLGASARIEGARANRDWLVANKRAKTVRRTFAVATEIARLKYAFKDHCISDD